MKRTTLLVFSVLIGSAIALSSCGGGGEKSTEGQKDTTAVESAPVDETAAQMARGEQIYKEKCIVCHMANGEGVKGAFPPLAGADYLLDDKVRAVSQVLNGSHMEITVNGEKYNAPMTPQVDTKEDAVAVINYVLNNFGNNGGYVTLDEVKDVVINPRDTQPKQ